MTEKGHFLVRIEDIDQTRCKPEYTKAIFEDLKWLGLEWEKPVRIQSEHFNDYVAALSTLKQKGLVYPCFCSRSDIANAATEKGPEGLIYPGTCRNTPPEIAQSHIKVGTPHTWRLNLKQALEYINKPLNWQNELAGKITAEPQLLGDVVLARKDTPTSYHLSVVIDDALQKVSHVIRGQDLFHATHIHVVLQRCLDLPTPAYHHHPLILDPNGKKHAKRNKSVSLRELRETGKSAANLLNELFEAD
jgi:glutamyl-Q tRNA(Asp) synthetase